jgi:hypothetical protein
MKHIAIALLAFFAIPSAHAKCANVLYTIAGTVVTAQDSAPVTGALVALAWNDPVQGTTLERTARTDSAGRYSIEVPFYPWSGNAHGADQCSAKLTEVSALVAAPGFVEQKSTLPIASTVMTANYSLKRTAAGRLR